MAQQIVEIFILIAGYIVGLGAVTVIDLHGFLGRKSPYWTKATIATHKVTKPLIWLGTGLVVLGTYLFYHRYQIYDFYILHWTILGLLIFNGVFLSFWVSPKLLEKEKQGKESELLPQKMQNAIFLSFVISFTGWWSSLIIVSTYFARLIVL